MKQPTPAQAEARTGRVVAAHGRRVLVGDGKATHSCRLFGRRLDVVCGDHVRWEPAAAEGASGLVVGVEPRRSELARISQSGRPEVVVANLDQMVAVLAPRPAPDFALCDRYLAGAEWAGLDAAVALNKADLPEAHQGAIQAELETYRQLGYPVVLTSKKLEDGASGLRALLRDRISVLVGQSGVGKSSLINLLVPGVEAEVQEISRASEEGRHTTTASALYPLPGGGDLMDSPGVRDFAPPLPAPRVQPRPAQVAIDADFFVFRRHTGAWHRPQRFSGFQRQSRVDLFDKGAGIMAIRGPHAIQLAPVLLPLAVFPEPLMQVFNRLRMVKKGLVQGDAIPLQLQLGKPFLAAGKLQPGCPDVLLNFPELL